MSQETWCMTLWRMWMRKVLRKEVALECEQAKTSQEDRGFYLIKSTIFDCRRLWLTCSFKSLFNSRSSSQSEFLILAAILKWMRVLMGYMYKWLLVMHCGLWRCWVTTCVFYFIWEQKPFYFKVKIHKEEKVIKRKKMIAMREEFWSMALLG